MIGGGDSVHESGEILAAEPLHCGVNRVEQVEHLQSFGHGRVLASVYAGISAAEDMQADIDVGTTHAVILLVPFDSLKLHEHRGERIDVTAGEMRAVVVPQVHLTNAGNGKEFFGDSCKNLFSHAFLMKLESDKLNFLRLSSITPRMMRCVSGPSPINWRFGMLNLR